MTMLDPGAREAARLWAINAASDGGVPGDDYIDGILTAYLSTVTPAEAGGLVDAQTEARAIVTAALPPHEQAILGHDAVTVLTDLIATALAAKDAELARRDMQLEASAKVELDLSAQLAEANKALEPFANVAEHDIGEDEHDSDTFWPMSNARYSMAGRLRVGHLRAARRALEAQGGE